MKNNLIYSLGMKIGWLKALVDISIKGAKESGSGGEKYKLKYLDCISGLVEILDILLDNDVSKPTQKDVKSLINELQDKYGTVIDEKSEEDKGRLIKNIRHKLSTTKQKRKNLKLEDLEDLDRKIMLWDDRLIIELK